jgi:hypothetical protein
MFFCCSRGLFRQFWRLLLCAGPQFFYFFGDLQITPWRFRGDFATRLPLLPELVHLPDYFAHLFPVVLTIGRRKGIQPPAKILLPKLDSQRFRRQSGLASTFHTHGRLRHGLIAPPGPFSLTLLSLASFGAFASVTYYSLSLSGSVPVANLVPTGSVRVSFLRDEALCAYQQNDRYDRQSDFFTHLLFLSRLIGYLSQHTGF